MIRISVIIAMSPTFLNIVRTFIHKVPIVLNISGGNVSTVSKMKQMKWFDTIKIPYFIQPFQNDDTPRKSVKAITKDLQLFARLIRIGTQEHSI